MKKMTEQQLKTLEHMKKTRKEDFTFLRDIIINKLKWLNAEKIKGQKAVDAYSQKVRETQDQIKMLDGAIIALEDVLHSKKESLEPEKNIEKSDTIEKKEE